ncbi:hypothetical protein LCGC14_2010170 [marine sediment metagenome]|uniref:Peptidase S74 domain-containing protein n=1 Tax=marine sediment metagenome TaxID=412755 RepID=A0A0F9FN28_9ZZZZ
MSKKNPKPPKNPAQEAQARISEQLFSESTPIRQQLNQDAMGFLEGDRDVTGTPAFAGLKDMIESQFGRARESVIGSTPTGGGLTSALEGVERGRAGALVQGTAALSENELNRAMMLGTGLVPTSVGGLGQAGQTQAFAAAEAQAAGAQKAGSSGQAAAQIAVALISKGKAPSDARLKDNVEKIGVINGHNIYQWKWNDTAQELGVNAPTVGVLAQEVILTKPDAVFMDGDYLSVDYSRLF